MKKLTFIFSIISAILLLSMVSVSQVTTIEPQLGKFDEIHLRISADIYYTQSAEQSVKIEGPAEMLERIEVVVEGERLIIKSKGNKFNIRNITCYISTPEIKKIAIAGSGDIYAQKPVSISDLDLNISGSGNLKFAEIYGQNLSVNISGSGNVRIESGSLNSTFSITGSGSGNVNAASFEAQNVDVRISGSGKCLVNAAQSLNVVIAGSGDVRYAGRPTINSKISGSGSVSSI